MPTIEQNRRAWNDDYDWADGGSGWSAWWGGVEAQWYGSILPRIHPFLPAATILEIAPGFGRWSRFLRGHCDRLVLVDLSERCIDACRARFDGDSGVAFHVNDGRSLDRIADGSIDFAFSYDSLVHADADVIGAYLAQMDRILSEGGVGFVHHSNVAACRPFVIRGPDHGPIVRALIRVRLLDDCAWRSFDMSAAAFERCADAAGLACIGQETVNWGSRRPIDCFSMFTRRGSGWDRPNCVVRNTGFMKEARRIRQLSSLYQGAHLYTTPKIRAAAVHVAQIDTHAPSSIHAIES